MRKKSVLNKAALKNSVLKVFQEFPFKKLNYKQVSKCIGVKKLGEKILVFEAMNDLKKDGRLEELKRGSFSLIQKNVSQQGTVLFSNKSGVTVELENKKLISVDKKDSLFSLKGDVVEIVFIKSKKNSSAGFITNVLERKRSSFVGTIQKNHGIAFFIPDDYKVYFDIFLESKRLLDQSTNKKVCVSVTNWNTENKNPSGKITEILGDYDDYSTEKKSILINHGFSSGFSTNVEKLANSVSKKISDKEISERVDFRKTTTFTIDPDDAKDFDDAISVKKLQKNLWEIGVHIADVSHYVKEGDQIDKEAFNRATSVYLVDRVIPMLPEVLSNDLCSLKPQVDRLCFSVIFKLDAMANINSYSINKTIINSNKRFTYKEAQKNIDDFSGAFCKELTIINSIAKVLRKNRKNNGSINFEKEETRFKLDKNKNPIDVYVKDSLDTNKLIEEYMLLANKTIAEHINKKTNNIPFVYRIHDEPDNEKIEDLKSLVKKYNHSIQNDNPKVLSKSLNLLLEKINDLPEKNLIETLILRSMAKAKYSSKNIGHYGLAFNNYSHFTSPIRRYPDLIVHRLMYGYLKSSPVRNLDLSYVCKHCSEKEKEAALAERESIKFMQLKYLTNRIGEVFTGVISGVTDWGVYVELDNNKCEGLVKIKNLSDDFLFFDNKSHTLNDSQSNIKYQLGQEITVKVFSVDIEKKQIDFLLA